MDNSEGLTDYELAEKLKQRYTDRKMAESVPRKRRGELRDDGYIEATDMRRLGPNGAMCIVWRFRRPASVLEAVKRIEDVVNRGITILEELL